MAMAITHSGFQPVEKQQKQVAYTHKLAKWSFSAQKQRLTLFYSLLRGVWVLFEVQRAERTSWGANPKGMTLRGPANGMADYAPSEGLFVGLLSVSISRTSSRSPVSGWSDVQRPRNFAVIIHPQPLTWPPRTFREGFPCGVLAFRLCWDALRPARPSARLAFLRPDGLRSLRLLRSK